jgi:hypothetical protein
MGNSSALAELRDNPLCSPPLDDQATFHILRFLRMLGASEAFCSLNLNALGLRSLPLLICRQTAQTEFKLLKNRIGDLPVEAGRLMAALAHDYIEINEF